eukprot:13354133-Alexandrium_andersonii.AAC.1
MHRSAPPSAFSSSSTPLCTASPPRCCGPARARGRHHEAQAGLRLPGVSCPFRVSGLRGRAHA